MLRETRPVGPVACAHGDLLLSPAWHRPALVRLIGVMWRPEIWVDSWLGSWGGKKTRGGFKVYAPFPFFQEFKHFLMIEAGCEMISRLHSQGLGICKYWLGIGAMSNEMFWLITIDDLVESSSLNFADYTITIDDANT